MIRSGEIAVVTPYVHDLRWRSPDLGVERRSGRIHAMFEAMEYRLLDKLRTHLEHDKDLAEELKTDPMAALGKAVARTKKENPPVPPNEDKITYRTAVVVLSAVVLIVVLVVGYKWFGIAEAAELKVPEFLVAIGSTALGALAGLLVPGGGTKK
jgi:hypothetical protein